MTPLLAAGILGAPICVTVTEPSPGGSSFQVLVWGDLGGDRRVPYSRIYLHGGGIPWPMWLLNEQDRFCAVRLMTRAERAIFIRKRARA